MFQQLAFLTLKQCFFGTDTKEVLMNQEAKVHGKTAADKVYVTPICKPLHEMVVSFQFTTIVRERLIIRKNAQCIDKVLMS
jgi:hypothetical protein